MTTETANPNDHHLTDSGPAGSSRAVEHTHHPRSPHLGVVTMQPPLRDDETVVDHEPDYRFTLANERTFLAWIRTALGFLAGGIVVGQFYTPLSNTRLHDILGAVFALLAAATSVGAFRRWRAPQAAMRRDEPLPKTPMTALLVSGFCLASALSIAILIL